MNFGLSRPNRDVKDTVQQPFISVVGSTNMDLITYAERAPGPGETVLGTQFQMGFGGKGANQAVMAALLRAHVQMITCVGTDDYARLHLENFASYGINTTAVHSAPGSSGVAPIWVEPNGTNRIIVVPGANDALSEQQARRSVESVPRVDVIIGQFEIPQVITAAAFTSAKERGAVTVLNPAPAAPLDPALLRVTDWLIPNEHELDLMGCRPDDDSLIAFASSSHVRLLVTLGEAGVALVSGDDVQRLSSPAVEAIDTTGAGDAFVGAFAFGLAIGMPEPQAAALGMTCASDSVTRQGTQASYPSFDRCVELMTDLS